MPILSEKAQTTNQLDEYKKLFVNADENKLMILSGLIEEAQDCKAEIVELKAKITELKEKGAKFIVISRREKLLVQKRASYTNMMSRICKELCAVGNDSFDNEGLEDYE